MSITYIQACKLDTPGANNITLCAFNNRAKAKKAFNKIFKIVKDFKEDDTAIIIYRYDYENYDSIFNALFKDFDPESPLILYDLILYNFDITFFLITYSEGEPIHEDIF